jgi:hypothetical protein
MHSPSNYRNRPPVSSATRVAIGQIAGFPVAAVVMAMTKSVVWGLVTLVGLLAVVAIALLAMQATVHRNPRSEIGDTLQDAGPHQPSAMRLAEAVQQELRHGPGAMRFRAAAADGCSAHGQPRRV